MTPQKPRRPKIFKHVLHTKVDDETYQKLRILLDQNPHNGMSNLLRAIITQRPVILHTRDHTFDNFLEELARLRAEIKSIGININQMTRKFNTYPEPHRKALYAKMAFQQYLAIEPKIDRVIGLITQVFKTWLQE
jgi:hypothetical protein